MLLTLSNQREFGYYREKHRNTKNIEYIKTYLSSILNIVLLSGPRAHAGGGGGRVLLSTTQYNSILVQIPSPLHCDRHGSIFFTHIVAADRRRILMKMSFINL